MWQVFLKHYNSQQEKPIRKEWLPQPIDEFHSTAGFGGKHMPVPGCAALKLPESPYLRSTHWLDLLPAVACKRNRERKQQIKAVPFMMAARRTPIVPLTIYTKAGRLKGTLREEAGHGEASWWRGWGLRVPCAAGVSACHSSTTHAGSWRSFEKRW